MNVLARTIATLDAAGVPHAVIGAAAMALYGSTRATADVDLLALDPRCLTDAIWESLRSEGAHVEIRRGDADDPLAGVVRIDAGGRGPVDVVVGRSASWQGPILERASARTMTLEGVSLPVVGAADLILLKLYAGGPQDRWDIEELLAGDGRDALVAEVEGRVGDLPAHAAAQWQKILEARA
jgi:predicted nucleotidyltransferase